MNARGNRRQPIILASSDVSQFFANLETVVRKLEWRCYAFGVMPNHYHLLLETTSPNLGDGMRRLNGDYARWFNRRYGFGGHLFQDRYHSAAVESERHLLELSRYIVLNPVRAGLCRRVEDWPWTSYRPAVGLAREPAFLSSERILGHFGRVRRSARKRYAAFVLDAPVRGATREATQW